VPVNLGQLAHPKTAAIFTRDPSGLNEVVVFILNDLPIPVPSRVRLDLLHSGQSGAQVEVARSPVERAVAGNIRVLPEPVTITGSISATPLGPVATRLGGFGSLIRRDLRELKKLESFQARREPVVLVVPWKVYPSMAMSITASHTGENKVDFTLRFEPLRIITPLTVTGALDLETLLSGAQSTNNAGAQPTTTTTVDVGGGLG
jgi:hypothetical protein